MQCPPSSPPRELAAVTALAAKLLPGFSPSQGSNLGAPGAGKGKVQPFKIYQDPDLPAANSFYPSPLPTSQADQSSPTRSPVASTTAPAAAGGRVALSQLGFVKLPLDGSTVTVGRSSKSSMVPLSATNKLVSRVHAKVHYDPAHLIVIECLGWNGLSVYVPCIIDNARVQKEYKVVKDQVIYIERVDGVSLNIHGERVIIEIEQPEPHLHSSEATEDEYPDISTMPSSPLSKSGDELAVRIAQELGKGAQLAEPIALHTGNVVPHDSQAASLLSDPVQVNVVHSADLPAEAAEHKLLTIPEIEPAMVPLALPELRLPVSRPADPTPEPFRQATLPPAMEPASPASEPSIPLASTLDSLAQTNASEQQVQVKTETVQEAKEAKHAKKAKHEKHEKQAKPVEPLEPVKALEESKKAGPKKRKPATHTVTTREPVAKRPKTELPRDEIRHKAINFVAFSRLASTPLSMVAESSPDLAAVSDDELQAALSDLAFIGVIKRTGKDALGKPLPNEYYYIPEKDDDLTRRQIVAESKGARTLRSCRKTHKQYFYKKPRV